MRISSGIGSDLSSHAWVHSISRHLISKMSVEFGGIPGSDLLP